MIVEPRKEGFHVVLTTHNSRTSQRMFKYGIKKGTPRLLDFLQEITLTRIIGEIIRENEFSCTAYNICKDHVHLIIVCKKEELSRIVGIIKGKSAYLFNRLSENPDLDSLKPSNGLQPIDTPEAQRTGNIETSSTSDGTGMNPRGEKKRPLWSQKFYRADLDIWFLAKLEMRPGYLYLSGHLKNATHYIRTNRQKHNLPTSNELQFIIDNFVVTEEEAFNQ